MEQSPRRSNRSISSRARRSGAGNSAAFRRPGTHATPGWGSMEQSPRRSNRSTSTSSRARRSGTGNSAAFRRPATPTSGAMGLSQSSLLGLFQEQQQHAAEGNFDEEIISECAICLEPLPCPAPRDSSAPADLRLLNITQHELAATVCGHIYHRYCIESWIISNIAKKQQSTCPLCLKDPGKVRRVYVTAGAKMHNSKGERRREVNNKGCAECCVTKSAFAEIRKKYEESKMDLETVNKKCETLTVNFAAAQKELKILQKKLNFSEAKIAKAKVLTLTVRKSTTETRPAKTTSRLVRPAPAVPPVQSVAPAPAVASRMTTRAKAKKMDEEAQPRN